MHNLELIYNSNPQELRNTDFVDLNNGIDDEDIRDCISREEQLRLDNLEIRRFNGRFFLRIMLYAIFIALVYYFFI
jgi:hypothetical protein